MAETDGRPTMINGLAVYGHTPHGADRLIAVHGSMDRAASFIKAIRRLRDLDIVRYDRRGYGRSVDGGVCASFAAQVDDLVAVLGGQPAAVVGHSVGGVIALAAAQRHPGLVTAVGAFEAPMPWAPWWPKRSAGGDAVHAAADGSARAAAERFMRRMIGDERWEGLPAATREARCSEGPALLADLRGVREAPAPYDLELIEQPIVAGRGTTSDAHHQRAADELARGGRHAELVVIEGADHGAHFTHPEEFAAFMRLVVERSKEPRAIAG